MEILHNDTGILPFDASQHGMRAENVGFTFIGAFCYFTAAVGIISVVARLYKRQKAKGK